LAGIYIHIPFCRQACHYCNFHFSTTLNLQSRVIESILKEIEIKEDFFEPNTLIETIYFGGGTPSMLPAGDIERIIEKIGETYQLSEFLEITLEANPDDLIPTYLNEIKACGVSRLSIGIQSFEDKLLQYMNRAHNREQAVNALESASKSNFDEVNIDLIYGIPGLTDQGWQECLSFALQFQVDHISAYSLTIEPKTALEHFINKKNWPAPDDDASTRQFLSASSFLEENGFIHYEISNFSKGESYSKHNTAYWKGKPYLGIGPSAHSYKTGERSWNIANNAAYIKALKNDNTPAVTEILSSSDQFNEYIMTGLRTKWGIDLEKIAVEHGITERERIENKLPDLDPAFFTLDGNHLKLTKKGWLWSDGICSGFFL